MILHKHKLFKKERKTQKRVQQYLGISLGAVGEVCGQSMWASVGECG